ncbi:MAG: DUF4124 domain-containing protein [Candidatus Binatia bacterium]|nr:DUF4124 domain-containing protein [Candidatus Binatia bacterium]
MRTLILTWSVLLCCSLPVQADLYQWTDRDGVIHIVDDATAVPEAYRDHVKVYRTATPSSAGSAADTLLSPSRTYAANSQGAFAQQLAFDLGLIKHPGQDALGPLRGVGIQPAGGWRLDEPLTPEALYEIIAAARRAADAKRLPLSPDGAEAVVRQAAAPFLPSPMAQPVEESAEDSGVEEEPEVIVIEQPPQIVEVIREPVYLPPVIVGVPLFPSHPRHRHTRRKGGDQFIPPPPPTGPHTTRPGPTHLPPRATHLPFGSTHLSPFPDPFFRR